MKRIRPRTSRLISETLQMVFYLFAVRRTNDKGHRKRSRTSRGYFSFASLACPNKECDMEAKRSGKSRLPDTLFRYETRCPVDRGNVTRRSMKRRR